MSIFSPVFFDKNFEDPRVLRRLETILKEKRGYDFKMPPKNSPVILIVSGGLDSTMLWFNLLHKYHLQVYPVHFVGPHSILGERLSVNFFYKFFKKRYPGLVKPVKFIPAHFNFYFDKKISKKIVDNKPSVLINNLFLNKKTKRNRIFFVKYPIRLAYYMLSAYEYGLELQTKNISVYSIFTGIVPDDGYTTRESTLTVLRAVNVYFCAILGDWRWQITGPLEKKHHFYFTKTKTLNIAVKNNVPIEKTWSCGQYFIKQCGLCSPCKRRQHAFKEAGVPDKTFYWISPSVYRLLKKTYTIFLKLFNYKAVINQKSS